MTILQSGIAQAAAGGGYQIARSLRFNSADSAYLNRTPGSAGNRKTWTWSGWVKRSAIGVFGYIFDTSPANAQEASLRFNDNNTLQFYQYNATNIYDRTTTQVFRDPSAWYHIVVAFDTTQATASNRIKLYVNGVQITAFSSSTDPSLNLDGFINNTTAHAIGRSQNSSSNYLNGYITDVYFIDGQALTPTSFGEFDANTGVWMPKQVTGMTYGTNGFYLNFSDNSNNTPTTLGKDSSGNGNNWTPNNFSVLAGVGNDSLVDSPTNYGTDTGAGGEVRGNYCTLNPLRNELTLANGNIQATGSNTGAWKAAASTIGVSSGKWYWEINVLGVNNSGQYSVIGVSNSSAGTSDIYGSPTNSWIYDSRGSKQGNGAGDAGSGTVAYGASYVANDTIGVALDMDSGTLTFYKNNTSQGVAFNTGLSGKELFPWVGLYGTSASVYINFGQRPFAYTAPSGFKALCTTNLPTPAIGATSSTLASKNMNAVLYTGNSSTQTITTDFQPDLVWIKSRSTADVHTLQDVLRGSKYYLQSNSTAAEATQADSDGISAFTSTGFTLGYTDSDAWNKSPNTYVSWNWKAGGTGVSNTSGTITSTVSANTAAGISVVGYTGTGATATVGHGLGVAPRMIIAKRRNAVQDWGVYHASIGNTGALGLNLTIATDTSAAYFNNTSPTSSVFSVGTGSAFNASTGTYVAYCFAEVAGFSKFGSYTGNGSADGPFVYCGFRPRYVMIKRSDAVGDWWLIDTARSTYNVAPHYVMANTSAAEASDNAIDVLSNGFKLRVATYQPNTSGGTFIFAAFAESPFNYARAR